MMQQQPMSLFSLSGGGMNSSRMGPGGGMSRSGMAGGLGSGMGSGMTSGMSSGIAGGMGGGLSLGGPSPPSMLGGITAVGTNTSNNDPDSVKCRVFVGNLNTVKISRIDLENIFRRYGSLSAISMHKGYAFVQFSNEMDARAAVQGEDQRIYANQKLDCNVVSEPKFHQNKKRRTGGEAGSEEGDNKRKKGEPENGTSCDDDVLICGNCKQSFSSIEALGQHKLTRCELKVACRCNEMTGIPQQLTCATCQATYSSAWDLCQHCQNEHGISLYVENEDVLLS